MYVPDPDDGDVLSAVLVVITIVATKMTKITSLKNNDAGYLFLLTLTFYKVLGAAAVEEIGLNEVTSRCAHAASSRAW